MTDKYLTSTELFEYLKKIIDLPDDLVSLQINLVVDNVATIDITRYATPSEQVIKGSFVELVHERFKLTKIE